MSTKESFLKDVANHVMEVIRQDPNGVYRHIRFRKPGTMCMHFDLITWPGYLCFTGDMGTYVFRRLEDMFKFFRPDTSARYSRDPLDRIDMRYWAEKLEASDKGGGHNEFDPVRFKREITKQRRRLFVDHGKDMDAEQRKDFWLSLDEVKDAADDGEHGIYAAVRDWEFSFKKPLSVFVVERKTIYLSTDDFPTCKTFTHLFRWCCYALAWGILKYDEAKA